VERQGGNQLDKRHKKGVTRGEGAMRSRGARQMGGGGVRRGYATTSRGTTVSLLFNLGAARQGRSMLF
jgi:hypothetical protein